MIKQLLWIVVCAITIEARSQDINVPYDYPVKPGDAQWKLLSSTEKKVKACQIPDNILSKLTTKALIQTCLAYPFFSDVFAANNLHDGLKTVGSYFNGLTELAKRNDAGTVLLSLYSQLDPMDMDDNWPLIRQGRLSAQFTYCELLLCQSSIISQLSSDEKKALISQALKKIESKKVKINNYGTFGLTTPSVLIAKTIITLNRSDLLQSINQTELNYLLKTGLYSNPKTVNSIIEAGKKI